MGKTAGGDKGEVKGKEEQNCMTSLMNTLSCTCGKCKFLVHVILPKYTPCTLQT